MSFVAIDLGASGSRYVSESGQISVMPNNMVFLPNEQPSLINTDAADIESCLEVKIVKESGSACEHFPANVLIGIMAEKHMGVNERPYMNMHKHVQRINYISAIVASAISRLKYELAENIDLYLAVPPIEIHQAREVFNELLTGTYTVTFPKYMGGTQVRLTINGVKCYEESFMASTSFFFNMNGIPKESSKAYLIGNVLSLDIGASTTDLAIIKNGRYLDKSGQTYKTGGNEARDFLMNEVCARYAMDMSIEDAEKSMAEGRLQQGNSYDDISDIVSMAKSALAKKLITHMQTYFKRIQIDITTINAIVVSGGGSMQSQYVNADGEVIKTSEPMSYYVTQELINWSKGTIVVPYGDEARFANVKGLFIRAKVDSMQATPVQPTQTAQPVQTTPVQPQVTPVQAQTAQPVQTQASATAAVAQPVQTTQTVNTVEQTATTPVPQINI